MFRRIVGLFFLALLVAAVFAATDPWRDKDFKDWDLKDVQRILTDSPWAKSFPPGSSNPSATTEPVSGPAPPPGYVKDKEPMVLPMDLGSGSPNSNPVDMHLLVLWFSSRTAREATARRRELNGTSADESRKDLTAEPDTYELIVQGSNMADFAKEGVDSLKAHSFLLTKKSKEKILPEKVILRMGPDGFRPVLVSFEFPRKTASGEPTIGLKEPGADFVTQVGKTRVKVSFDISKMVDKKGTDL